MAAHTFTADTLITLPRRNAHGTLALTSKLLTEIDAARTRMGRDFSHAVAESTEGLRGAVAVLDTALTGSASSGVDPTVAREAHADLDACWSGFVMVLEGWVRVAGTKYDAADKGQAAARVLAAVAPDRLAFTHLPFFEEWSVSETKLHKFDAKLEHDVHKVGADQLLAALRESHAAYGKVLGITHASKPPVADAKTPSRGDAYLEVNSALRVVVLKLLNARDEAKGEAAEELERLVQRVYSDEGTVPVGKGGGESGTAPETTPAAAPTK